MQDLPVILKRDNLQRLDKALDFFIEERFLFSEQAQKCKVVTYNIVSEHRL